MNEEKINNFHDLKVWEKSHKLVLYFYNLLDKFPKEEKYRIIDQLLRALVSIPTNIAEGTGRFSNKDYIKFLIIARGSVSEVQYLIFLSYELKYLSEEEFIYMKNELDSIGKMLNGLINSLRAKND